MAVLVVALVAAAGFAHTDRHTVRKGETLASIARKYGVSVGELANANNIKNRNLVIAGATLTIPGKGGAASHPQTYQVRPGDTLGAIARRFGTSVGGLITANAVKDANLVFVGARLVVPGGNAGGAAPTRSYTVGPGDTLTSIARRFGTMVDALVNANKLADADLILRGAKLNIGGLTPAGASTATGASTSRVGGHIVQPGETLQSIATKVGVPLAELARINGFVAPYRLSTGTRVLVKSVNPAPVPAEFTCPVAGARFINDWGFPRSSGRFHAGNDMFAAAGTPVRAPMSGYVVQVTGSSGGREFRLTAGDGTVFLGSHMDRFGAKGRVDEGAVVGYVGSSGNARGTPSHLHFQVHPAAGGAVNPYPLLLAACR